MEDTMLNVSSSPHVRAKDSTNRIMLYVIIALLPTTVFGIINLNNDLNNLNKYEFKAFKDLIIKNNNLRRYYRNYLKSEKRLEREYKLKRLASLKSRA